MKRVIFQWCLLGLLLLVSSAVVAQPEEEGKLTPKSSWLLAGYSTAVAIVGYNAWWNDNSRTFHTVDEGWLESDSYRGGADKFGHMYTTYLSTRLLSDGLVALGNSPQKSLNYASWTVGLTSFGVEVLDGYTEEFGFSYEDLVFNLAGIAAARFMESNEWWDQRFDFRFYYRQSGDSKRMNKGDVLSDYSGQTYLLMAKLNGFSTFSNNPYLRYVELGVGYGSRGYHPSDGTSEKQQKLFFALSLNLSELLNQTLYKTQHHPSMKQGTDQLFEYLQLPQTTMMTDRNL